MSSGKSPNFVSEDELFIEVLGESPSFKKKKREKNFEERKRFYS